MDSPPPVEITRLLEMASQGDTGAWDQLWTAVYQELRRIARQRLAREAPGHAPQPTSLVHQAFLKFSRGRAVAWSHRGHFFSAAARAMREILVDDARKRGAVKRGGGRPPQRLTDVETMYREDPTALLDLDEALRELEEEHPEWAEVLNLHSFAARSVDEIAEALGVCPRTVDKRLKYARAWLYRKLGEGSPPDDGC